MWSRRAQEYEAKINSGDLIAISEVVRDLYRSQAQPEPSYSERQLYEQAIDRMSREVAVVEKSSEARRSPRSKRRSRQAPSASAPTRSRKRPRTKQPEKAADREGLPHAPKGKPGSAGFFFAIVNFCLSGTVDASATEVRAKVRIGADRWRTTEAHGATWFGRR
jgi:hypothetical protein